MRKIDTDMCDPDHTKPFDRKLFFLMMLLGVLCGGFGALLSWTDYASVKQAKAQAGWSDGEAVIEEVGIRTLRARNGWKYEMIVRYMLHVDGRSYEGRQIAAGYDSKSGRRVMSLIAPFAPEASSFDPEKELSVLLPERTWQVGSRPVRVRYDPRDPSQSQMLLDNPIVTPFLNSWVSRAITFLFLVTGALLFGCAWMVSRPKKEPRRTLPPGPALSRYPETDRRHLIARIECLQAGVADLVRSQGWVRDLRMYAQWVDEMAAAAHDGTLVPAEYARYGIGRGADEVYGDCLLSSAACELQECLDELAGKSPLP